MEANLISGLRQCCRQPSVKATAGAAPISARTGAVDKRRTHFSTTTARTNRSGARQPAVVGKPDAVRRKSPTIRRRCDRRTRAAGVSPPWYRKPHLQWRPTFPNPARSPGTIGFRPTAGLRQPLLVASADAVADVRFVSESPLPHFVPRLAYASRSWLRARMLLLKCVSYPKVRYPFPRLAYASRSWLRARMLLRMCVLYPKVRYPFPRLAYASRSWLRGVCSVPNATFAMHKRMCTRAAGVSPPWCRKLHLQW
jgi:hypothetical protein